jgi:DNA-binding transcriptional LysR family regulator
VGRLRGALEALGVSFRKLKINIELPSNEAVLAAILAGAAATILSAVKAGTLKQLPVHLAPRASYAVQHAECDRSRAVSALLKILRACCTFHHTRPALSAGRGA